MRTFACSIALLCCASAHADMVIDFEDLTVGSSFQAGEVFQTGGATITVLSGGGSASVLSQNEGATIGTGNKLWIGNVTLDFDFGGPIQVLQVGFGYFGGDVSVRINDQEFDSLFQQLLSVPVDQLPIESSGLVFDRLALQQVSSGVTGTLQVVGQIESIQVFGQEFAIDDLSVTAVPEVNSSLLLLLPACIFGYVRKRCASAALQLPVSAS